MFCSESTAVECAEHRRLRRTAFVAVAVSTVAVMASIVTLPLFYNHIQSLQSHIAAELDHCRTRSRDMWTEVFAIQESMNGGSQPKQAPSRRKREWMFGKWLDDHTGTAQTARTPVRHSEGASPHSASFASPTATVHNSGMNQCCTCHQGPVGEPGPPGEDGRDGEDGKPGMDGLPGQDGQPLPPPEALPDPCIVCPPGPAGAAGPMGSKGPPGPKGAPGLPGTDGKSGEPGMVGPQGATGRSGNQGAKGPKGPDGVVATVEGSPGPRGAPGPQGVRGSAGARGRDGRAGRTGPYGLPGDDGLPGPQGKPGPRGRRGPNGSPGSRGSCQHCPKPRLPPGY